MFFIALINTTSKILVIVFTKRQAKLLINSIVYRCFERWSWECNV